MERSTRSCTTWNFCVWVFFSRQFAMPNAAMCWQGKIYTWWLHRDKTKQQTRTNMLRKLAGGDAKPGTLPRCKLDVNIAGNRKFLTNEAEKHMIYVSCLGSNIDSVKMWQASKLDWKSWLGVFTYLVMFTKANLMGWIFFLRPKWNRRSGDPLPYGQFSRELVGVGVAVQCGAKGKNP